ncbi:MAG: metal ABC transporter substrate-binding protein [Elusimicrobiota bacterium]
MKKFSLASAALLGLCGSALAGSLKVVATTPDLASIARAVGGDRVRVESLAAGAQNPHFVEAKPSLMVKLMKADLFVQTGLDLESGWAPPLVQGSRNRKIQPGAPGHLDASAAVSPLEIPADVSRSGGDVHPGGNPHYLQDPENGRLVARLLAQKMAELSPEDAGVFQSRLAAFETSLDEALARWHRALKPHAGAKFVSYHRTWPYFARRFGLVSAGEIEPKPGIPPTAEHTAALVSRMKAEKVRIVFTDPWYETRTPAFIARQSGAALAPMALQPGARPGTADYLDMLDHNVKTAAEILGSSRP